MITKEKKKETRRKEMKVSTDDTIQVLSPDILSHCVYKFCLSTWRIAFSAEMKAPYESCLLNIICRHWLPCRAALKRNISAVSVFCGKRFGSWFSTSFYLFQINLFLPTFHAKQYYFFLLVKLDFWILLGLLFAVWISFTPLLVKH